MEMILKPEIIFNALIAVLLVVVSYFWDKLETHESKEELLKNEFSNKSSSLFAKALLKNSEKFTMSTMDAIIGFVWKPDGNTLQSSKLLQLFREHFISAIKPEFLTKENVNTLKVIVQDYRNKAAHIGKINETECSNFISLNSKLLNRLSLSYM